MVLELKESVCFTINDCFVNACKHLFFLMCMFYIAAICKCIYLQLKAFVVAFHVCLNIMCDNTYIAFIHLVHREFSHT